MYMYIVYYGMTFEGKMRISDKFRIKLVQGGGVLNSSRRARDFFLRAPSAQFANLTLRPWLISIYILPLYWREELSNNIHSSSYIFYSNLININLVQGKLNYPNFSMVLIDFSDEIVQCLHSVDFFVRTMNIVLPKCP